MSCGGGLRARSRFCLNGLEGDEGCNGDFEDIGECQTEVSSVLD